MATWGDTGGGFSSLFDISTFRTEGRARRWPVRLHISLVFEVSRFHQRCDRAQCLWLRIFWTGLHIRKRFNIIFLIQLIFCFSNFSWQTRTLTPYHQRGHFPYDEQMLEHTDSSLAWRSMCGKVTNSIARQSLETFLTRATYPILTSSKPQKCYAARCTYAPHFNQPSSSHDSAGRRVPTTLLCPKFDAQHVGIHASFTGGKNADRKHHKLPSRLHGPFFCPPPTISPPKEDWFLI